MKQLVPIGKNHYEKFAKDMTDTQTPSFNESVTTSFSRKAKPDRVSAKHKLKSLKDFDISYLMLKQKRVAYRFIPS